MVAAVASAVFDGALADDTTGSSFTLGFSDVTAAGGKQRLVAVAVIADSGSAPTLTVTIDGETAELVGTAASKTASGATNYLAFFLAPGTSATTFDVVVGSTASCFCCYASLWTLENAGDVLDSAAANAGDGSPLPLSVDTEIGGLAFGAALGYQGSTNPTAAWAGLAEDADSVHVFTDEDFTAASLAPESASSPLTVSCTWDGMNGSVQAQTGVAISFAPIGGGGGGGNLSLLAWEGGPAYYEQFAKAHAAGWSDPSFFPFGVFLSPSQDSHAANLAEIGITHYASIEATAGNITAALAAGMNVWPQMAEWDDTEVASEAGSDSKCCAWFVDDEPDMNEAYGDEDARLAEVLSRVATAVGYADSRFTALNIGNGVLKTFWSPNTVQDMVRAVDVCGVDQYAYSSSGVRWNIIHSSDWPLDSGEEDSLDARCAATYGWIADQMRSFQDPSNRKPFFVTVEVAKPLIAEEEQWISTAEVEGAVWAAICHEARGIMFFQHNNNNIDPTYALSDAGSTTIRAAVAAIITKVNSLASVINSQTRVFDFQATGIFTMLKMPDDGYAYIFAHVALGGLPGDGKVFTLPAEIAGTTVEVVGESRSLNVVDGAFSDDFDEEYTHHVYKIALAA